MLTNLPGGFNTNNIVPRGNGTGLANSSLKDDGVTAAFGQAGLGPAAQVSILTGDKYALTAQNSSASSGAGYFSNTAFASGGHAIQAYGLVSVQSNAGSGGTTNRRGFTAINWNDGLGSTLPTGTTGGAFGAASNGNESKYGLSGSAAGSGVKFGVYGTADGAGTNYGIYGVASGGTTNVAGYFQGAVNVTGVLTKGSGTFKIDHPQDPENKFLYHSFVESPDMMNVYNGNIVTDKNGDAIVTLPAYFESLNKDFRYQLTVIGTFANAIVGKKVFDNQFMIKTDKPNVEVSWQITGIRKDPYAEKNRIVPEVEKGINEKGKYLHPEAFGLPKERGINNDIKPNN